MEADADGVLDDLDANDHELSDDGTEIDMPEIVDSDSSDDEDPEFSTTSTATDGRTLGTRGGRLDWTRRKSNCHWRDCCHRP